MKKKGCLKQSFGSIYQGLSGAKGHFLIRAHPRLQIIAAIQFKKHASFGSDQGCIKVCGPRKTRWGGVRTVRCNQNPHKNSMPVKKGRLWIDTIKINIDTIRSHATSFGRNDWHRKSRTLFGNSEKTFNFINLRRNC